MEKKIMVIDYILDRKDGYGYDVKEFYDACMAYEEFDIARALDGGTEKDVKKALCDYVIYNDYPKSICKYINSENWLDDDYYESKKSARKSLKEGINDELIATSSDGETTLYLSDERQANHGKDPHYEFKLGENGYFTRYIRCDDIRCENVVLNWIKEFDLDISKSEISKIIKLHESKKSARKSTKESKVDFQSVIDKVLPKEYAKNKNAYRYALSCVTSLYNEDEYDSDSAKVYFLNCYISDLFPSWVDELGEEEIDAFANALYDGTMKWSDIDSSWLESKKSVRKSTVNMINSFTESLKEYLVKGLDVDFVVDHLLSLEDPNNFDLINELDDLWKVYKKSWNKFNKSLSDFWKVMKDIEKLDSFDKTCEEIIDAWYDDIEKIFYSDDNLENLKLNYGFEGNDLF